jgi:hypothetical protein
LIKNVSKREDMMGPIGVDLDNTIIGYDRLLLRTAFEHGLIDRNENYTGKKVIRDSIRELTDGEIKWQKLQAEIYGPRLNEADLIEGVSDFFLKCREQSIPVFIVSHKTEFAKQDQTKTNLRSAVMSFLESHRFFNTNGLGISRNQVFFESSCVEKVARIKMLNCSHFIDDLEETFQEACFPEQTTKILFDPHGLSSPQRNLIIHSTWFQIMDFVFKEQS